MGILTIIILAPKKFYYSRSNPDPNPPDIVDNLDQIGKKEKKIDSSETKIPLKSADSLPKELLSLSDIEFDLKFEKSLFRTKSETHLKEIVLDHVFTSFVKEKHQVISTPIKSDQTESQSPVERVNVTRIKSVDEAIKLANFLSQFKTPVSQLYTTIFPAANSTMYATTSFTDSAVSSPPEFVSPELPWQPRIIYSSYPQSTASSSIDPFIPELPLQPKVIYPSFTQSITSTTTISTSHTTYFSSPLLSSSSTFTVVISTIPATTTVLPSLERIQAMVARYASLVLPQNLHDMPQNYQKDIPLFDNFSQITTQQHIT